GMPELVDRADCPQQAKAVGVIQECDQVIRESAFPCKAKGAYLAEQPRGVEAELDSRHKPAYPHGKPGSASRDEPEQRAEGEPCSEADQWPEQEGGPKGQNDLQEPVCLPGSH